jgi:hypothetical protein
LLAIIGSLELFSGDSNRYIPLIVGHAPYKPCAAVKNHFVKYFNEVEIACHEWFHFNEEDYYQEGCEVHVEELRILVVVTIAQDDSKEETTEKEYSR